ncbi:hypothetical protein [Leptospira kmetyi]|uniref:hypothetical protein n=1 Tax=Leptospira kmetyi TaxID=408139 RepID=UPI00028807B0|nr:hypothetical protein [Leptospira kmetyi]EQA52375.1 hypothetical protein LEP1GSC052_3743 [Leptospira kmetyi serovar Malaysia str. Bejo-Iso9]
MNSFLLWWNLLDLKTKVYAILIFGILVFLLGARGVSVFSKIIHGGGSHEVKEINLSPGSAYDSDCVPESGRSCP